MFKFGTAASRIVSVTAVVAAVGLVPWLAGRDPALSILRARSGEQDPTEEALGSIRRELGLDADPVALFGNWLGRALRGDLGASWVNGQPVLESVLAGLGVSLTLMGVALAGALLVATALCVPTMRRGLRGDNRRGGGAAAAVLAAAPEFLLAALLIVVVSVWLGWLPPYGWQGPQHLVLPALAMALPAGAVLGRLVDDALPPVFGEQWVSLWRSWGCSRAVLARGVLRRALPPVLPQVGLAAVGIIGGAVSVEVVFAIPGVGRTALGAAESQDLPLLQGSVIVLLLVGMIGGVVTALVRRRVLGPALRDAALITPPPVPVRGHRAVVACAGGVVAVLTAWGLTRDPLRLDTTARLSAPSWAHPLGTDSLGRDVLARVGHGALATVGVAVAVCAFAFVVALLLGFLPSVTRAAAETANAVPPVIAGLLVAATLGPDGSSAALAVALVSWPVLSEHAASLVEEARAAQHVAENRALGASPVWTLRKHVLPAVVGPLARHAVLRLPGIALALASLGFLGLGTPPPAPEWGLLLSETLPYVERAPWATLAPAGALLALAVFAVSLAASARVPRRS
ncbi:MULTISPECIES: ABC transporter permease subunit [Actinosynnema]|uniref:ABC transporter permease subunit n=1 Tax=Actinosynnema TaxID=40566 RepID=UPI0020A41BF5|nr:ABC transporter permease subunit [Actinosynnema pretiosum]MCP2096479.1 peptide/nickel transport system permease protein [Actinosynnema pretiosum]